MLFKFLTVIMIIVLFSDVAISETIIETKTSSKNEVKISATKINNKGVIVSLIVVEIEIFTGDENSAKKKEAMDDTFFCIDGIETTIQKPEEKGEFIIYKFSFKILFSLTTEEEASLIKILKNEIIDILGESDKETTEKMFYRKNI